MKMLQLNWLDEPGVWKDIKEVVGFVDEEELIKEWTGIRQPPGRYVPKFQLRVWEKMTLKTWC